MTENESNSNVVYCLVNGGPNEYVVVLGRKPGEVDESQYVVRFDNVPDELADRVMDEGPGSVWGELYDLPHQEL